ncbi:MAG: hypothetical protein KGD66_09030 [Candidatus Lokiarchaeota archaeon]|nr:hypothetical protein [Candidatus Lokiarchaeota archaeon]
MKLKEEAIPFQDFQESWMFQYPNLKMPVVTEKTILAHLKKLGAKDRRVKISELFNSMFKKSFMKSLIRYPINDITLIRRELEKQMELMVRKLERVQEVEILGGDSEIVSIRIPFSTKKERLKAFMPTGSIKLVNKFTTSLFHLKPFWKVFTWIVGSLLASVLIYIIIEFNFGFPLGLIPVLGPFMFLFILTWVNFILLCVVITQKVAWFSVKYIKKGSSNLRALIRLTHQASWITARLEDSGNVLLESFLVDMRLRCIKMAREQGLKKVNEKKLNVFLASYFVEIVDFLDGSDFRALLASIFLYLGSDLNKDLQLINARLRVLREKH